MKIKLKRAIQLPNAEKTILRPGVHNIPDDVFSHWFIQGLVDSGEIIVINDEPVQPVFVRQKPAVNKIQFADIEIEEIKPKNELKVEENSSDVSAQGSLDDVPELSIKEKENDGEKIKKIRRRKKKE